MYVLVNNFLYMLRLLLLLTLTACDPSNTFQSNLSESKTKTIVQEHSVSVLSKNSFKVSVHYSGDSNENASAKVFYCNETDSPGCDALAESSAVLQRSNISIFSAEVNGLSSPNDPQDVFNYMIEVLDEDGVDSTAMSGQFQLLSLGALSISNLVTTNITNDSFDVTVDFSGDENTNSTVKLYYCNATDTPSCDPTSDGISEDMTRGASSYTVSLSGLSSPDDEGDTLNIEVVAADVDGVNGSPISSTVRLPVYSMALSNLDTTNITNNSFDVAVDFSGDENSNGSVKLYYCNATDTPSCDPTSDGISEDMTRGASSYTVSLSGLSSPDDEGDTLNIEVVAVDTDGVSGSPVSSTVSLAVYSMTLSNLATSNITSNSFDVAVDFSGDENANGSVKLYYCNATDTPSCDPTSDGISEDMTRGASSYTVSLSSLSSPTDQYNIRTTATDVDGTGNSPLDDVVTLDGTPLDLDGLTFSSKTKTGFVATVLFKGDLEENGTVTLYYCNNTDSPGCDPVISGVSGVMSRGASSFTMTVSGLTSPNDEADILNVVAVAEDPNGEIDSPKTSSLPLAQVTLTGIELIRATMSSFDIQVNASGDPEANSTATLYYCNKTDSPGCDPEAGASTALSLSGDNYVGGVSGLTSPNDLNDLINLRVIVSDPEGVYQSPQNLTIRLTDLEIGPIVTYNFNVDQFSVDVEFTGDSNADGSVTLYYCNETDNPGCNPTAGESVAMSRFSEWFTADVFTLPPGYDPGDTINVRAVASDPDGSDPDPLNDSFPLPNPTDIYRSVGAGSTLPIELGGGANTMTIVSSTATFGIAVANNIGVGDAIQYDTNGGGDGSGADAVDSIVFIHSRVSSTQFVVKTNTGGVPIATNSDTDWSIFRAYSSMSNAASQIENSGIDPALNSFDGSGSRDISARTGTDQVWHLALYNDAVFEKFTISNGWSTSVANYLHIFTPHTIDQVGVSQRHFGAWTDLAARIITTNETPIAVRNLHSVTEGLQIYVQSPGSNSADGINLNLGSRRNRHIMKNNLLIYSGTRDTGNNAISATNCGKCFSINNIIVGYTSGIYSSTTEGAMYVYNNTIVQTKYGLSVEKGDFITKNTAVVQCSEDSNCHRNGNLHVESEYNVTDGDLTGDWGANSFKTSQTLADLFVSFSDDDDYTNDDFRIRGAASDLVGRGNDLSADVSYPFSTDIEGGARTVPWDVGADEL